MDDADCVQETVCVLHNVCLFFYFLHNVVLYKSLPLNTEHIESQWKAFQSIQRASNNVCVCVYF